MGRGSTKGTIMVEKTKTKAYVFCYKSELPKRIGGYYKCSVVNLKRASQERWVFFPGNKAGQ